MIGSRFLNNLRKEKEGRWHMKKAKYLFLKNIKLKEKKKAVKKDKEPANKIETNVVEMSNTPEMGDTSIFSDDDYEYDADSTFNSSMFNDNDYEETDSVDTMSEIQQFSFDYDWQVSKKEALVSIEAKSPFVVGKIGNSKAKIEETDRVYRTIPKIKYTDNKRARRIGYVEVTDKVKVQRVNPSKSKNIVGIVSDDYLITKKKGFNQRKIGYIKLKDDDSGIDKYVEITKSKGLEGVLIWLILIDLILLLMNVRLPENWNFDWKNLTLYKTEEQTEYRDNIVRIEHNAEPILKDGQLGLDLTSSGSTETDGKIQFILKIVDVVSGEVIYQSEMLEAGTAIQTVEISKEYEVGEFECKIVCDTYRDSLYIGTVESVFIIITK